MPTTAPAYALDWQHIDTLLLDMDGTLLDLHYDNRVWNEIVPRSFAEQNQMIESEARDYLFAHMAQVRGTIEFYCFEYWTEFTGLDLLALHQEHAHLVTYRPGALDFLRWARAAGKKVVLATNAHPHSISVKEDRLGICAEVDQVVSSHTYAAPKEHGDFWQALQTEFGFDSRRTFFADDNEPVLDSAREFGIEHVWCVATPDSNRPRRDGLSYPSFHHFREICPAI